MPTNHVRNTARAVLAATVAMTAAAGPAAHAAPAPAPAAPTNTVVDSALSANIDAPDTILVPEFLADMAQHAADAGVAGAAGALAGRAFAKKQASSGGALRTPQGAPDSQFDAPTN